MKQFAGVLIAITALAATHAAAAEGLSPDEAIRSYCEPLLQGEPAKAAMERAHAHGFRDVTVGGHPMLMRGEMLLGLSDAPRVCAVQAPKTVTPEQGFALADAWGKRHPGAQLLNKTRGPDGSPVRAWTAPGQKMALIAVVQTNPRGDRAVLFLVQPLL